MTTLPALLKELKERVDKAANMRSDDFGHDCSKLAEWESSELQVYAWETIPRLIAALELALYYVEGDATYEALCEKIARILGGEK